ncbi:phospholipid-translocating P-type ATPase [Trypanosoma vivax]|nr:phospholipid-translocating P-type ATPase [Trypanosoma vivax]
MRAIQPLDAATAAKYPCNTVTNSWYTVWNFIFLNLYEQFRRPLNFYFLLVSCLQFISIIAPVSPFATLLPLIAAFSLTALKEGYDDIKRHKQDKLHNNKKRTVLNRTSLVWETRVNSSIRVGDVVRIERDEDIPCDVVALAMSGRSLLIRTDNLDGELDLKPREVVRPPEETLHELIQHGLPEAILNTLTFDVTDSCDVLAQKLAQLTIECAPPSPIVDSFDGMARFKLRSTGGNGSNGNSGQWGVDVEVPVCISLNIAHLLPQSCILKGVDEVIGVAVYTGEETKCGMNKRPPPVKWAKIDQMISRYSIFIFVFQLFFAIALGLTGYLYNGKVHEDFWYMQVPRNESTLNAVVYPLRFFLLTSILIPISFKFVVDVSKYYLAKTVEWDVSMIHDKDSGDGCHVRNSSILEDLAQVDCVLSDKTGTLTQNVMELLHVTIGDKRFSLHECEGEASKVDENEEDVLQFGRVLSLCNTVEVASDPARDTDRLGAQPYGEHSGTVVYQAASPDEAALCCGAGKLSVRLTHREQTRATLMVKGIVESWFIHYVFPFSSELKTMGIVVEREGTGLIYYFVKGADDRIAEMSTVESRDDISTNGVGKAGDTETFEFIGSELKHYATRGLRTLLIAQKRLSRDDLNHFLSQIRAAELLLTNRQEKLGEIRRDMESGVRILGATAIEDKLQDGVCESIQSFLEAGIRVWMLTGDKVETAEQIGLSCALYSPTDTILRVVSSSLGCRDEWEEKIQALFRIALKAKGSKSSVGCCSNGNAVPAGKLNKKNLFNDHRRKDTNNGLSQPGGVNSAENSMCSFPNPTSCVLIVEGGPILEQILTNPRLRDCLIQLCESCTSVICARVTPSQKAAITQLVRSRGFMTLAVGDGGNDVAMLQEAHVGVGIAGKEGKQAVRASDFSITRFSDLRVLMFVHGQMAYIRTAYVIKYSFYKSVLIGFVQVAYNVYGMYFSGGSFWNSFSLMLWNGLYTFPHTFLYCLDRKAPRNVLEQNPFLYKMTRSGVDLGTREFFLVYFFRGIAQAVVAHWLVLSMIDSHYSIYSTGDLNSKDVAFTLTYSAFIILQMLTLLLESNSITFLNSIAILGMPPVYVLFTTLYSSSPSIQYYGVWNQTINLFPFLMVFVVVCALVVPTVGIITLWKTWCPDPRDILRNAAVRRVKKQISRGDTAFGTSKIGRCFGCVPEGPSYYAETVPEAMELTMARSVGS